MQATMSSEQGERTVQAWDMQIGMNGRGRWVVRDASGRRGGIFVGKREALKFALSANGHRPDAVMMVPWPLELMPQEPVGHA